MSSSLERWLTDIERRHPQAIDLGLDRVASVWRALGAPRPARRVIVVGGTNGKGSTVAFLEAAAASLGWRVGAYTSPHLFRYTERVRLGGVEAQAAAIVQAFERIEAARGETSLTYFEYGTLAALLVMAQASPVLDLALLEVGLGGRLDAVNIIDADVAVVTTVALDHQAWLGETRAAIAGEKAGIARPGRPLIIGESDSDPVLIETALKLGADVRRLGSEYGIHVERDRRWFHHVGMPPVPLPDALPLPAPCQWDNAATALAALVGLERPRDSKRSAPDSDAVEIDLATAATGLTRARLPGRLQQVADSPEVVVDVGHNPQAAQALADWLASEAAPRKKTHAVFSALADKDIEGIVRPLLAHVSHWYLAGLSETTPRGLTVDGLADRLSALFQSPCGAEIQGAWPVTVSLHATVGEALTAARNAAQPDERVLAFGSFYVVAEAGTSLPSGL